MSIIPTRSTTDPNSSSDINTISSNAVEENVAADGQIVSEITTQSSVTGNVDIDLNNGNYHIINIGAGNIDVDFLNAVTGVAFVVEFVQDGVGSRTITFNDTTSVSGGGSLSFSTTANAVDVVTVLYNGTTFRLNLSDNHS